MKQNTKVRWCITISLLVRTQSVAFSVILRSRLDNAVLVTGCDWVISKWTYSLFRDSPCLYLYQIYYTFVTGFALISSNLMLLILKDGSQKASLVCCMCYNYFLSLSFSLQDFKSGFSLQLFTWYTSCILKKPDFSGRNFPSQSWHQVSEFLSFLVSLSHHTKSYRKIILPSMLSSMFQFIWVYYAHGRHTLTWILPVPY